MSDTPALYDPNQIDPLGTALQALVEAMSKGMSNIGQVCEVFELCGHPLCQASVALFFELEKAKDALGIKEPAP